GRLVGALKNDTARDTIRQTSTTKYSRHAGITFIRRTPMKVIRRRLLDLAVLLTIFGPCRTAFAQKSVAMPGPNGTISPAAAPTETAEQDPKRDTTTPEEPKKESRRTDHFRIGVLGGVGFPRPLSLEGMVKIENLLGI